MSNTGMFRKSRKDGSPIDCKFCKKPVWVGIIGGRIYDVGGELFHVENCDLRKAHYKSAALDNAESRRQGKRPGPL